MIPFGAKRTLGNCRTVKSSRRKIIVIQFVKNRKLGRIWRV